MLADRAIPQELTKLFRFICVLRSIERANEFNSIVCDHIFGYNKLIFSVKSWKVEKCRNCHWTIFWLFSDKLCFYCNSKNKWSDILKIGKMGRLNGYKKLNNSDTTNTTLEKVCFYLPIFPIRIHQFTQKHLNQANAHWIPIYTVRNYLVF